MAARMETLDGREALGPEAYEAIFANTHDGVFFSAPDGRIFAANDAACDLLEMTEEEICRGGRDAVADPGDERWKEFIEERARTGHVRCEVRFRRPDGTTFVGEVSSSIFRDAAGEERACVIFRDVTDRHRAEQRLRSVVELTRELLQGTPTNEILTLTARRARNLVGATHAWVITRGDESGLLLVVAGDGDGAEDAVGRALPLETPAGEPLSLGRALLIDDLAEDSRAPMARTLGLGPAAVVPMGTEERRFGTLFIASRAPHRPFTDDDLSVLTLFAQSAAVALAMAEARQDVEDVRWMADHDRIARDLHDNVIQRLFATGMGLQAMLPVADTRVAPRLKAAVAELDDSIRQIRTTIFDLEHPGRDEGSLRVEVRDLTSDLSERAGVSARVRFDGPVDSAVDGELREHLVATLREALANVARHARAERVDVVVAVAGDLVLTVADDGIGPPESPSAGRGLGNMRGRAEALGGSFRLSRRHPTGAGLEWRVPAAR